MRKRFRPSILTIFLLFLTIDTFAVSTPKAATAPVSAVTAVAISPVRPPRETAIRRIGIAPFSLRKGSGVDQAQVENFVRQVANDLSAMSYVEAIQINGSPVKAQRSALLKILNEANLDGVMLGEFSDEKLMVLILSRNGDTLVTFVLPPVLSLESEAQIKAASRALVDEFVRSIPYRGFVTRRIGDGLFEINLGKNQGLLVGQRFRLFDLTSSSLASERRDRGEVQVVAIADSTATIEATSHGTIVRPFMKVGFNENAHGMTVAQQVETRGYATLGGSLLNISGTGDPKYVDRAYNVSSTPGLSLGGAWNKYSLALLFAQAKGDQADLVYTELIANTQIFSNVFGSLNRFSVLIGGRLGRVSITTKRDVVTPLQSTTSISPEFVARLDRIFRGPVRGFADFSVYYPIFVTGMETSALPYSFGVGGDLGVALDLSQRLFLDVGARYHLIRRPVDTQSAVQEIYSEFFTDLGFRF